jgi:hypothetical protein
MRSASVCHQCLVNLLKSFTWLARNDFRFNGNLPVARDILSHAMGRLNYLSALEDLGIEKEDVLCM